MPYGEPTYGESGEVYTDKVRNSLAYVKAAAEAAQATADNAVASIVTASQSADEALEVAEAAKAFTEAPTDGRVAQLVSDTASSTRAALLTALVGVPTKTPPTDPDATTWLSSSVRDLRVSPAPGDRVAFYEGVSSQECSAWYNNGRLNVTFTSQGAIMYGYNDGDPLNPADWAAPVALFGTGVGGFAGNPGRSRILIDGSTIYLYFMVTDLGADEVYVATAPYDTTNPDAAAAWTIYGGAATPTAVFTLPAGAAGFGNPGIVKHGSTYCMTIETIFGTNYQGESRQDWLCSLATATSPLGPFTHQHQGATAYLTSTRVSDHYGDYGSGSPRHIIEEGGVYTGFFHAGEELGSPPNSIYRATTTDPTTNSWTVDPVPVIRRTSANADQVADPAWVEMPNGESYFIFEEYDNGVEEASLFITPALPVLKRRSSHDPNEWVAVENRPAPQPGALVDAFTIDPVTAYRRSLGTWTVDLALGPARLTNDGNAGGHVEFDVCLRPGEWTVTALVQTGDALGILEVSLSTSTPGPNEIFALAAKGTMDCYAATGGVAAKSVTFNLYGDQPQLRSLRFKVSGANPSAVAAYIGLLSISLARTPGS